MTDDDPGDPLPDNLWWTAWIIRAQKFAYGELGLKPWEFWDLTIDEYNEIRIGYYRRRRLDREMQATWVCVLVNHFPMRGKGAKTLRVEDLIGHSPEKISQMIRERDDKLRRGKKKRDP